MGITTINTALADFTKKYPSLNSGDLQTFIKGWGANEANVIYLLSVLQSIADWPGNLSDDQLTTKTGPNDAAYRGSMVITMRAFAYSALSHFKENTTTK